MNDVEDSVNSGARVHDQGSDCLSDRWENAKKLVNRIGSVPNSFSSCVFTLISSQEKNNGEYSAAAKGITALLLRGHSVLGPLYFATRSIFRDEVISKEAVGLTDFLNLYQPIDLAGMIGLLYYYKRIGQLCPDDIWEEVSAEVQRDVTLAAHIGRSIEKIGIGRAVLSAGLPRLATLLFLVKDPNKDEPGHAYKQYRKHCEKKNVIFDLEAELHYFGCTHAEVAGNMLQSSRYGIGFAQTFTNAMARVGQVAGVGNATLSFSLVPLWVHAYLETGKPPEITHKGGFYPLKVELDRIEDELPHIKEKGAADVVWLDRGKGSLTPETTPQIFATPSGSTDDQCPLGAADGTGILLWEDLPEELLQHFPKEEYEEITSEIRSLISEA